MRIVNGTYVDGKQINANQLIILRKGTQIVIGEMSRLLVINGIQFRLKYLIPREKCGER